MEISKMREYISRLKTEHMVYDCQYNVGCGCEKRHCGSCGWNPVVAQERTEKLMKKMGVSHG